jgi:hypothetical protein
LEVLVPREPREIEWSADTYPSFGFSVPRYGHFDASRCCSRLEMWYEEDGTGRDSGKAQRRKQEMSKHRKEIMRSLLSKLCCASCVIPVNLRIGGEAGIPAAMGCYGILGPIA